jgi:hypothetical protein
MDITIKCHNCQTDLTVDESMLGQTAPCPSCGRPVQIKAATTEKKVPLSRPTPAASTPLAKLPNLSIPAVPPKLEPSPALLRDAKLLDWLVVICLGVYLGALGVAFVVVTLQGEGEMLRIVIRAMPGMIVALILLRSIYRIMMTLGQIEANTRPVNHPPTTTK